MNVHKITMSAVALLCGAPVWAVSLSTLGPVQPMPAGVIAADLNSTESSTVAEVATAGSNTLVPLMAADLQARPDAVSTVDSPANGAAPVGKTMDDLQFVRQATESGRKEIHAAQEALPQLKDPELKRVAEMLANDHDEANERLAQIAESKGWPVPGPGAPDSAPPAGTASSDFDARFTAQMIAGHERAAALYRAQAATGEDKDLRKYANDTLPIIEKHLAELRRLQK